MRPWRKKSLWLHDNVFVSQADKGSVVMVDFVLFSFALST